MAEMESVHMDKQELLTGLTKALEIAKRREDIANRELMPKYRALQQKQENAQEVGFIDRIKMSFIPGAIYLFCILMVFLVKDGSAVERFFATVWLISGAIVILINVFARIIYPKTKLYTEKIEKLQREEKELIDLFAPRIGKTKEESLKVFPQLGYDYHTVRCISKMIGYINSGRADTIKELIEAYELDCHRERVEAKQDRIMYELEEQQNELNHLSSQVNYVTYYKK